MTKVNNGNSKKPTSVSNKQIVQSNRLYISNLTVGLTIMLWF